MVMEGCLNEILPESVSPENENALRDLIKRKMKASLTLAVEVLHAMENHFGPEVRDVLSQMVKEQEFPPRDEVGDPETDLKALCTMIDHFDVGSHQWQRVVDTSSKVGYRYTRCLFAEILRELGEPALGMVFCAGDEPWVRSFNPRLGLCRTQTLMEGHEVCDHIFYVKE
jgi:hypothetical protein